MQIRTGIPSKTDKFIKFYNNSNNGGISLCINGEDKNGKSNKTCNVLPNCVGWACARFNEIYCLETGTTKMKYSALRCYAENFYEKAKSLGLKTGQTPKVGAIMCWQKGATLNHKDGAGHVCIVEKVNSDGSVKTSESGWGSTTFYSKTRQKGTDGRWGQKPEYKFLGFIYNPIEINPYKKPTITIKKGSKGEGAKWVQWQLKYKFGYDLGKYGPNKDGIDGSIGATCESVIKKFQKAKGLTVDGKVGPKTREALK